MPVFRVNNALHYYAHVPKCAGSAVADYLIARCGTLAFQDTQFLAGGDRQWTKSSPQHVDWASFTKLIPADWIASSFAVVRHPTARVISAYHFQKEVEKTIPEGQSIDEWFTNWADGAPMFAFDNHLLPQSQIVPPDATVFKIEDGLDAVVSHLDAIIGDTNGARIIGNKNIASNPGKAQPSQATLDRIAEVYAEDFARFSYPIEMPTPVKKALPNDSFLARLLSRFRRAS